MNRTQLFLRALGLCVVALLGPPAHAQAPIANGSQQLVFAGLRTTAAHGQINSVKTDSSGNIYLLLDGNDGVELLEVDPTGTNVLAQAHLGATGDIGLALALDPAGNLYVTGTSTSSALVATSGAAFPTRAGPTMASFLAKFDAGLHPSFVTFLGGRGIAASAVAATGTAVLITGSILSSDLPVTPNAAESSPAAGSTQNGFVERFSADGNTLLYATYLSGVHGDTNPSAIAVDPEGNAYIVGSTTSAGFPTVQALVPAILSNPSGFVLKLAPAGDTVLFATFVPGAGLSSIALSSDAASLLITGAVALGQFPVDTVTVPLVSTTYQVLLHMPLDGTAIDSSTLIAPGLRSSVAAASGDTAWISGVLTAPLLPAETLAATGLGLAAHVIPGRGIDQVARFGGLPDTHPSFASLATLITSVAVDPAGNALIAGAIEPTASAALLASERYDLPLRAVPTTALPSTLRDAELTAAACSGSLCAGSAAYLAKLNPHLSAPALAFSTDDAPSITLRNLGSAAALNLHVSASSGTFATTCGATLAAGGECELLLSGGAAGALTASASNSPAELAAFPPYSASAANTLVFTPKELDFGTQTAASNPGTKTLTITNLGLSTELFTSALDGSAPAASPFSELSSDCTAAELPHTKTLLPGSTCHITLSFTASSSAANDGFVEAGWLLGAHDVLLTGYREAAALSLSSAEIDFGTQFTGGLRSPRYLYLSNSSAAAIAHAPLIAPPDSSFTLKDECPSTLPAATVCRIRIDYLAPRSPSNDAMTLALDGGLSALITGESLPAPAASGGPGSLSVAPAFLTFPDATFVTEISSTAEPVTLTNTGALTLPLALSLLGDFIDTTTCGASLAPAQSCTVAFSFSPTQPGIRQGFLTIATVAGATPIYLPLSGTASPILAGNSSTLDLGSIPIGQPTTLFVKVTHSFTTLTATASGPYSTVLVEDVGFGHGQPSSNAYAASTVGSCHNCYIGIQFLPDAAGTEPGTLTLTSNSGGSLYALNLTGVGTSTSGLVITPAAVNFHSVPVHSVGETTWFTITNLLPSQLATTLPPPVISGDFTVDAIPTGGQLCSGTLAYSASCFIGVAFAPTAVGTRSGTVALASATILLSGLATADPGLSLSPLALTFHNVPGAAATQQVITLRNTGTTSVEIAAPANSSPQFTLATSCTTLAPAASCSLTVHFQPANTTVLDTIHVGVSRTISGASPQTSTFAIPLSGAYTAADAILEILPNQTSFGPAAVNTPGSTRQFTINNLTANSLALTLSLPRDFFLAAPPCPQLLPHSVCTFSVTFLPLTSGDHATSLLAWATPTDGSPSASAIAYVEGFGLGAGTLTLSGGLIVDHVFRFGEVTSGQSSSQLFTYTNLNAAGTSPITIRRVTSPPPFLSATTCNAPLAPGQSCTVTVTYQPANFVALGASSPPSTSDFGSLIVESDAASSPDILNLSAQGGPLATANPAPLTPLTTFQLSQQSLTFPPTATGNTSAAQSITLTNTGNGALHFSSFATPRDFAVQTTCATVAPGASCAVLLSATPQSEGAHAAALAIHSDSSTSLEYVSLFSSASPPALHLSSDTLDFGSVSLGNSATEPLIVTNTGFNSISSLALTASPGYTVSAPCPTALAPGASCTSSITFTPPALGIAPGTLTLSSPDLATPTSVPLTGTGVGAPTFSLTVNGTSSANVTVTSGDPATYPLTVTSLNGFSGAVALTCTALDSAPAAACSLLPASLALGADSLTSTATITTFANLNAGKSDPGPAQTQGVLACLLLPGLLALCRAHLRRTPRGAALLCILCATFLLSTSGCGGNNNNFRYLSTPPGSYRFQVAATSTTGVPITQTVTLHLTVTSR